MKERISQRESIEETPDGAAVASALASGETAHTQRTSAIAGFDHVALPMQNVEATLAFYRGLGLQINEGASTCSVYVGNKMINLHRPEHWRDRSFTLRAPAARPPCADLCFAWDGTPPALKEMLDKAGAKIFEGPVPRQGGHQKLLPACTCAPGWQPAGVHDLRVKRHDLH